MATVNEKMTAIADAIRAKTGETEPLTLDDMAGDIPKVFDAGKQAQQKEFMDLYFETTTMSVNGSSRMFAGTGWNSYTFYPTQDIDMSGQNVFNYFAWGHDSDGVCDLVERLNACDVKLDCSNGLGATSFGYAWVSTVPKLTVSSTSSLNQTFRGAKFLHTITELEFPEDNNFKFDRTFENNSSLRNIVITGMIATAVDFGACSKLTKDSILGKVATAEQITNGKNLVELNGTYYYGGILGALKDYSGSGATYTLTLGTTNLAKLTDAEKALATQKGWTLA